MTVAKQYLELLLQDEKRSVRFATAAALPAYARVGNRITASANGALPAIDGVAPAVGDGLLLLNGAAGADNGLYTVTQLGDGSNPFILDRRDDADQDAQVTSGLSVRVSEGATYGASGSVPGKQFILITPDPIVLNTTALDFQPVQDGGGGSGLLTVRAASVAPLPAYTRLGNVITASANGALPAIDGVALVLDDALLYQNGSGATAPDNGVYVVTQVGSGGSPFILTRHDDLSDSAQAIPGMVISAGPEGAANRDKLFSLSTPGPITLNTTDLEFECISNGYGLTDVVGRRVVPVNEAMLFSGDLDTGDDNAELDVEGEIESVETLEGHSVLRVPPRGRRTVHQNDQMIVTSSTAIEGVLEVDGQLDDISPPSPPETPISGATMTTSAVPATIATYLVQAKNRTIGMSVKVVARDTANDLAGHYTIEVTAKRDASGTVSILETLFVKEFEDNPSWDVLFDVTGPMIRARVQGVAGASIAWRLIGNVIEHG